MKKATFALALTSIALICPVPAHGDFWSDLGDSASDVATAAWRNTTAPIETVANTARVITGQADADTILDPYRDLGNAAADATESGYSLAQQPEKFMYAKVQRYARQWGGDEAGFVFDLATFSPRLMSDLGAAGAHGAANVMRGQNPLQLTAAPLAAAIRAAREVHLPNARPLPADVREGLTGFFTEETLNRAKYAVGKVEITLPNLLGRGNRMMGDGFAVVVDDIIVFNEPPPAYEEDQSRFWWAHELTHVGQYRLWGVERFAWEYLRDVGRAVEGEADQQGTAALTLYQEGKVLASLSEPEIIEAINGAAYAATNGPSAGTYQNTEYFTVRCNFPFDQMPVAYFVTNLGRIIAVNNLTGASMQVGTATPPMYTGASWTYMTPYGHYSVLADGRIVTPPDWWGRFQQVGQTEFVASVARG